MEEGEVNGTLVDDGNILLMVISTHGRRVTADSGSDNRHINF